MKFAKPLAFCLFLALSNQAIAKITSIQFAKGSYCGSFSGNYNGRTFAIKLNKGQTLTVSGAEGVRDVIVKNPNGKVLRHNGHDYAEWTIRTKGTHTIKLIPYEKNNTYTSIEFCAY